MVIAVISVRAMKVSIDEKIDVVAVGNRRMATAGAVSVPLGVSIAGMGRRACRGIRLGASDGALVDVPGVQRVQMPIMGVIDVPLVGERRVTAAGSVQVWVILVGYVLAHDGSPERAASAWPPGARAGCRAWREPVKITFPPA